MVSTEVLLKFVPSYGVCIRMCCSEGIPPVGHGAFKSSKSIQDLLPIVALCNVQLLSYDLKPVIGIQAINRIKKRWGMMTHKVSMLVPSLECILLLGILLVLLDLLHWSSEALEKLHLTAMNCSMVGLGGGGGNCWPARWLRVFLGQGRSFTIWLVRKCII
jgi:hypothetical protein